MKNLKMHILLLTLGLMLAAIECTAQSTIVPYNFTTIAGELEIDFQGGYADGTNASAQFDYPEGLALDSAGNLYVADKYNEVIRKMTHAGTNWITSTIAGQPGIDGYADSTTASAALFNEPRGVAVDSAGNVYIADAGNNLIRELTPAGVVSTIAGVYMTENGEPVGGYQEGPGLQAQFDFPVSIAVDSSGNLYVGDYNNSVIRKLTKSPSVNVWEVSTLAGSGMPGSANGLGTDAEFDYPWGVAVDSAGNVYVADTDNNEIRKITPGGMVSTLAGFAPSQDALDNYYNGIPFSNRDAIDGTDASFFLPYGVAVDTATNVYVADSVNNEIRKISPQGVVTTLGGQASFVPYTAPVAPAGGYNNGTGSTARFNDPVGVAVDNEGNLYVADTDNCVIREGTAPTVQVVAMEVTQVIQDWNNDIPLIQGKETYVRAHLQLASLLSDPVMVSGALLYGTAPDGSQLPNSPTSPINTGASLNVLIPNASNSIVRRTFDQSLNFRLPSEWLTGTVTLQLAWPGGLVPVNVVLNNCSVQVTFVPAGVPQVKFFDVQWTDFNGTKHQLNDYLQALPNIVLSCYPVASVDATYGTLAIPGSWKPDFGAGTAIFTSMVTQKLKDLRNADIALSANAKTTGQTVVVGNRIYHGGIQSSPGFDKNGIPTNIDGIADAPLPSFASSGTVLGTYGEGRQTVSHEICHNLGCWHDTSSAIFNFLQIPTMLNGYGTYASGACGEASPLDWIYSLFQPVLGAPAPGLKPTLGPLLTGGTDGGPLTGDNSLIYGLDTLTLRTTMQTPVLAPIELESQDTNCYYDLMSYCRNGGPEDVWPSSVTYASLLRFINYTFPPATPALESADAPLAKRAQPRNTPHPRTPGPQGGGVNYLIVRGTVDFLAATAQFLPCLQLTTTNTPPAEPPGTNFVLAALDDTGAILQTVNFALQPNVSESLDQNLSQTTDFLVFLTNNASIHTLTLSCNGALLATLTASPTAPTLTLTAPTGGQSFTTNTVNISWSASDTDGDTLSYTVQYSADDGATWETLAVDWPEQTFAVNTAQLAATTEGLVRVIASDGFNTTTAQSAAFTVEAHPPAVNINAPMDGSIFIADQQVFLDASVNDMQDGPLNGANVQWYSDRDGSLGAGAIVNFNAKTLSEGAHTITVTATDSEGLTNSAVTHIVVLYSQPPQLSFQVTPRTSFSAAYGTLSWPSYYTNYVLQTSSNLTAFWTTLSNNPPALAGNQQAVNVGISNKISFYRLMLQP